MTDRTTKRAPVDSPEILELLDRLISLVDRVEARITRIIEATNG